MRKSISIEVMSLGLVTPISALMAQQARPSNQSNDSVSSSAAFIRYSPARSSLLSYRDEQQRSKNASQMVETREILAKGREHLGLSPEKAAIVAKQYRPVTARHRFNDIQDSQKAVRLIQRALKNGQYMLANQLLIDYMRSNVDTAGKVRES